MGYKMEDDREIIPGAVSDPTDVSSCSQISILCAGRNLWLFPKSPLSLVTRNHTGMDILGNENKYSLH